METGMLLLVLDSWLIYHPGWEALTLISSAMLAITLQCSLGRSHSHDAFLSFQLYLCNNHMIVLLSTYGFTFLNNIICTINLRNSMLGPNVYF